MLQGTAFHLKDLGVFTCDHCVRDEKTGKLLNDLKMFKGNNLTKRYDVEIMKTNQDIDIAKINVSDELLDEGLEIGNSDNLQQLNHIAATGYPNYNYGDNGIFSPGLIVGFRTYSGLRHLLVNTPLISGNSGGPVFDRNSKVIGIAVTGAEKMSEAVHTEKHGVIPIEAIRHL